jgi:hypothetical protein
VFNGLQTLQAMYPLSMHSLEVFRNSTFSNLGFLAVQDGLQKIPVVLTAVKNNPSNRVSFSRIALYMMSIVKFIVKISCQDALITKILWDTGVVQPKN